MVTKSEGWIDRDEKHIQIKDIIKKAMSSLLLQYSSRINNLHTMLTKSAGWLDRDERHIQIKDITNKAMSLSYCNTQATKITHLL